MSRILVTDRASYAVDTAREYTADGYLKVPAHVARTGVQEYMAGELGLSGREPTEIVRVYRPASEVFKEDSLKSYEGADVTVEHPKAMVDSKTFKDVSKGFVLGAGEQSGDFVKATLIVKDADAIEAIERGKNQVSAGYLATYDEESGITPEGEPYDYIQRDIVINHVAIVDRARAGAQAKLFDSITEMAIMPIITLDNKTIEVRDANAEEIMEAFDSLKKALDASYKEVATARAKAAEAEEKADMAEAKADAKEAELEKEKAKTSDSALGERLREVLAVRDLAVKIAGEGSHVASMDSMEIMRDTMKAVNDSVSWDEKSDVYVQARFDAEVDRIEKTEVNTSLSLDSASAFSAPIIDAYTGMKQALSGAWKQSIK